MTIRIGNSFVDDDTSSAVDTEFGRGGSGGAGSSPSRTSGASAADGVVSSRMLRWKASVEKAQRITGGGRWAQGGKQRVSLRDESRMYTIRRDIALYRVTDGRRSRRVEVHWLAPALTEEHVLEHDGLLREAAQVARLRGGGPGLGDRLLLDARPGQVDVEEQQQGAKPDDGGLQGCFPPDGFR